MTSAAHVRHRFQAAVAALRINPDALARVGGDLSQRAEHVAARDALAFRLYNPPPERAHERLSYGEIAGVVGYKDNTSVREAVKRHGVRAAAAIVRNEIGFDRI